MKKEQYFTPENIADKSRQMLADIMTLRRRKTLSQDKCALLVLDMQVYFLSEKSHAFIPSANAVVANIDRLAFAFGQSNRPVIATRHVNTAHDAGAMATWWRRLITSDDPLSAIVEELKCDAAIYLQKTRYDAFYKTPLIDILHENRIEQIIICGLMTHLCCETTARSAFMHGFDVFFTIDGTATYNEAFHRASLINLAHGFAVPVLTEEIIAGMQK